MNGRDIRICTIFAFAKMEFMEKLHPIMFAGTGSDVGKSIIAAAFCRIFKQDGYQPAPFKAQNMALNSFATPEGLEIGRAQAVQAEAAGVPCHTDMNPLLLKPQSDHTSQVVLNGRPIGNRNAYEYFRKEGRDELRREVCAAYDRLAARYNPVVLEGAGSISEINLRDTDLVNLPMALHAGADVILVGDIDRGGVFASVYGSLMLLRPHERERIKGILINKFRGDIRLFESGITMLEELCGIPVVGVVPYYRDIYIEEEDSVALAAKSVRAEKGKVNIAVILLRHLSNFTDFNVLERDPRVHLFYTNNVDELAKKFKPTTVNALITAILFVWCVVSLSGVSTFLYLCVGGAQNGVMLYIGDQKMIAAFYQPVYADIQRLGAVFRKYDVFGVIRAEKRRYLFAHRKNALCRLNRQLMRAAPGISTLAYHCVLNGANNAFGLREAGCAVIYIYRKIIHQRSPFCTPPPTYRECARRE